MKPLPKNMNSEKTRMLWRMELLCLQRGMPQFTPIKMKERWANYPKCVEFLNTRYPETELTKKSTDTENSHCSSKPGVYSEQSDDETKNTDEVNKRHSIEN